MQQTPQLVWIPLLFEKKKLIAFLHLCEGLKSGLATGFSTNIKLPKCSVNIVLVE